MPSLFNRSNSFPRKGKTEKRDSSKVSSTYAATSPVKGVSSRTSRVNRVGEFGALGSSSRDLPAAPPTPPISPASSSTPAPLIPPKYSFLPTRIPHQTGSDNSIDSFKYATDEVTGLRQYGFLGGVGARVILGLEDAGRVVQLVAKELEGRGLTTPMLFSNQALDLNQTRTRMLIQAYIDTLLSGNRHPSRNRLNQFAQDLRFAREHELAWLLRWALSRVTRVAEGTQEVCHGVLEWEVYEEWRGRERAANYPTDAFPYLAALVPSEAYSQILSPLFHLLSRLAAHSHLSGLTPHAISSLFASLLFDVPSSSPAMVAHATFVRSASATEHLLLSYIRSSGSSRSLGVADLPGRLKEWVAGYPAMLASDADLARGAPRRGARVIRCERAIRTVRAYSKDLIVSGELWAQEVQWEAFDRVFLRSRRGEAGRPKFSNEYRRRLCVKETPPLPSSAELTREVSYGKARLYQVPEKRKEDGDEAKWGSLAGKEWSLFEEGGFDAPILGGEGDIAKKLTFDLNESAKISISQRRQTMDWTEFASPSGGFNRTDPLLDVSLTFSPPIGESISDWPKQQEDLRRRLHKTQKEGTPFNYDTAPRVGGQAAPEQGQDAAGRVYLEEAFVDAWADLMMGAGWVEREELTFKDANWVIVEYKARPRQPKENHPRDDPRTSELYFLYEERVPTEYQLAVADPKQKRAFSLFSPKKKRGPSNTSAPIAAGWQDSDFDRMLLHRAATKKIVLSNTAPSATVWHKSQELPLATSPVKAGSNAATISSTRNTSHSNGHREKEKHGSSAGSHGADEAKVGETKNLFFNSKRGLRRVKTDEEKVAVSRKEHEVDFELQSTSGVSSGDNSPEVGKRDEDKWMDILIANGARRMDRQDAPPPLPRSGTFPQGLPPSPHPPLKKAAILQSPSQKPGAEAFHTPETSRSGESDVVAFSQKDEDEEDEDEIEATPRGVSVDPEMQQDQDPQQLPYGQGRDDPPVGMDDVAFTIRGGHANPPDPYAGDTYEYVQDEHPQHHTHTHEHGHDHHPGSSGASADERGILSPVPRRDRDTITGIVDTYRDSTATDTTEYMELTRPSGESHREGLGAEDDDEGGQTAGKEEAKEQLTTPPGPIFDLTPGREPTPARYKHGEPLHFVGEEPEEEEY